MQPPLINKEHYGKIAERLRIRLDLASFKCKHGYQNIDLYTMESFFPTAIAAKTSIVNKSSTLPARQHTNKRRAIVKQQQQQPNRYYPTHQDNHKKESFSKPTHHHHHPPPSSSPPLSAKRSTSPSRTDELTARLLLWMCHQKRTTDSA